DGAAQGGDDRPLAVARIAERIDDAADDGVADGDAEKLAGAAHLVALGDFEVLAEDDHTDGVFFEVEGDAADAGAREFDHLPGHDRGQAVDTGDAVAHFQDAADLAGVDLRPVLINFRLEN